MQTALYLAVDNGHLEAAKILIEDGKANVTVRNGPARWQVLHLAAHQGRSDLARLLAERAGSQQVGAEDADGRTAAQVAR